MKRQRKKYDRPRKPWDKQRILKEKALLKTFGLRRKKEIWIAEALLRKYRRMARELAAKKDKEKEKVLIKKLIKMGLLKKGSGLDDVLSLTPENILERRLQTVVFKKGLSTTAKQARQFIVHGKILLNNRKITYPSYLVKSGEEDKIIVTQPKMVKSE